MSVWWKKVLETDESEPSTQNITDIILKDQNTATKYKLVVIDGKPYLQVVSV